MNAPWTALVLPVYNQAVKPKIDVKPLQSRVGHIRRFVHVAPQNPLTANPVKVCYSTFLFEGP